jgi:universal stress protein E
MIKKVLAIASPRMEHTDALRLARELAMRSGARLHLVLLDHDALIDRTADLVAPEVMLLARAQFEQVRQHWLAAEAAVMAADGIDVEQDMLWAPEPHEAVIALCLELQPDLVIKDACASGARNPQSALDRKLVRLCPAPVLLVPQRAVVTPRRVVAAVDTSPAQEASAPFNDGIVAAALALACALDAELHVAHTFPFEKRLGPGSPNLRKIYRDVGRDAARAFTAFADRHQVPADRRHWMEGLPERRLPGLVGRVGADVLVLGTTYRSGLDRFLLGSTCERLLHDPPCSLLVVKPEGFVAELSRHVDLERARRLYAPVAAAPPRGGVIGHGTV